MPKLLWGHDQSAVTIGKVVKCYEDNYGLKYRATLPKDDTFVAGRIAPQLKHGSIDQNSIGFQTKQRSRNTIKTAELWEISLVNIAANQLAVVSDFKSLGVQHDANLPIADRSKTAWDYGGALARVKAHFDVEDVPTADFKSAFLYVDPDNADSIDGCKFLIADVIDGRLRAVPTAIYRITTALKRAAASGEVPSETVVAIEETLNGYYHRLELPPASKALTKREWGALEETDKEDRLRSLGLSKGLAKELSKGQRDVGRRPQDAGLSEGESRILDSLKAIHQLVEARS